MKGLGKKVKFVRSLIQQTRLDFAACVQGHYWKRCVEVKVMDRHSSFNLCVENLSSQSN